MTSRPTIQVFGSDLDARSARDRRARGGIPLAIEADVTEERLRRFFTREAEHYRGQARTARRRSVRDAQPAEGSAVFAPRSDLLSQFADLSRSRAAGAGLRDLPLRAQLRAVISFSAPPRSPTIRRACFARSIARRASISRRHGRR